MPKIYEYLGIVMRFYSNEHKPIHIHAIYGNAVVKVSFYIKNGEVHKVTYQNVRDNFPSPQMNDLKKFVSKYKNKIVWSWDQYFVWGKKIRNEKIARKLK